MYVRENHSILVLVHLSYNFKHALHFSFEVPFVLFIPLFHFLLESTERLIFLLSIIGVFVTSFVEMIAHKCYLSDLRMLGFVVFISSLAGVVVKLLFRDASFLFTVLWALLLQQKFINIHIFGLNLWVNDRIKVIKENTEKELQGRKACNIFFMERSLVNVWKGGCSRLKNLRKDKQSSGFVRRLVFAEWRYWRYQGGGERESSEDR